MVDAARLLHALEVPAALIDAAGVVREANAAFRALDADVRAAALASLATDGAGEGWRGASVGDGLCLLTAADPRLARRARMLATLSHEVRTPLNGVLGMAGLLASTRLDPTQAAYLATLRASGEHLLSLVEEVLDYARLDAGRVELEPAVVDVEHLLQTVCELLSPRAHAAGLEIAWAAEGAPPRRVIADDGRLRQVLFNLAGNAVKLTGAGGVLLTVAQRPAARAERRRAVMLRFSVRDTGPGLDRDAQSRVWEEFEQAGDGARAGGAGLGLAIVRRLAEAFGGRLGVQSRPGEGALFWFEAEFALAEPTPASVASVEREALAGISVGLVSNSPVVAAAAVLQIEAEGGRVLRLDGGPADPARALVDVLLVDASTGAPPPPPAGAPALVLLAAEARERIAEARALGYAGWLIKPLRRASVADRIRAVLGRTAEAQPVAARSHQQEDERAAPSIAAGLRVLLAEDNAVNALLARALLQREGCEVERVATGLEAVAAARGGGFDLVLMDLRMPGLDGLAATVALRAAGVHTPVVALTANAFDDDRRACREAGLDGFLTKPLDPSALRATLARWGRPQARPAA